MNQLSRNIKKVILSFGFLAVFSGQAFAWEDVAQVGDCPAMENSRPQATGNQGRRRGEDSPFRSNELPRAIEKALANCEKERNAQAAAQQVERISNLTACAASTNPECRFATEPTETKAQACKIVRWATIRTDDDGSGTTCFGSDATMKGKCERTIASRNRDVAFADAEGLADHLNESCVPVAEVTPAGQL